MATEGCTRSFLSNIFDFSRIKFFSGIVRNLLSSND
nr:MAG TPA: hypothetical protein [Caudoviricetes sp.]